MLATKHYLPECAELPHADARLLEQLQHGQEGHDHVLYAAAVFEQTLEGQRAGRAETFLDGGNAVGLGDARAGWRRLLRHLLQGAVEGLAEAGDEAVQLEAGELDHRRDILGRAAGPGVALASAVLELAQPLGELLEATVFLELPRQLFGGVLGLLGLYRGLRPGQQAPRLDQQQLAGHDQEFGGGLDLHLGTHEAEVVHVLVDDQHQRHGGDIQLVALDYMEQQIERPLEDRQLDRQELVPGGQAAAPSGPGASSRLAGARGINAVRPPAARPPPWHLKPANDAPQSAESRPRAARPQRRAQLPRKRGSPAPRPARPAPRAAAPRPARTSPAASSAPASRDRAAPSSCPHRAAALPATDPGPSPSPTPRACWPPPAPRTGPPVPCGRRAPPPRAGATSAPTAGGGPADATPAAARRGSNPQEQPLEQPHRRP